MKSSIITALYLCLSRLAFADVGVSKENEADNAVSGMEEENRLLQVPVVPNDDNFEELLQLIDDAEESTAQNTGQRYMRGNNRDLEYRTPRHRIPQHYKPQHHIPQHYKPQHQFQATGTYGAYTPPQKGYYVRKYHNYYYPYYEESGPSGYSGPSGPSRSYGKGKGGRRYSGPSGPSGSYYGHGGRRYYGS
mmetsp:Transcript_21433/g.24825  ORF Transcript_21433/g.24825 Transcript_21433/m.24825 type:complete len:191 (-) Transcript_21433:184-756(-)